MDSSKQNQSNQLADSMNEFTFELHRNLAAEATNNIFFSPFSIITALAMTYLGARSNTAEQMEQVLHFKKMNNADIHKAFEKLTKDVLLPEAPCILRSANRLYAQNDYTFLEDFLQKTQLYYKAGLVAVDFKKTPDVTRVSLNTWVSEQTNNKIKDLIPPGLLTPITKLVLVNALYFKGNWLKQFDKDYTHYSHQFRVSPTESVPVDLMFMKHTFLYHEDRTLKCQVLSIPYIGNRLSMVVILPDVSSSLTALETQINIDVLSSWRKLSRKQKVKVHLPRFKLEESFILNDQLTKMGMSDLFSDQLADLSGITGGKDLYVSNVIHKAFIEVNEEGTEAAAATAVDLMVGSSLQIMMIPEFIADRPFLFLIQDDTSGCILFLGRVTKPTTNPAKDEL